MNVWCRLLKNILIEGYDNEDFEENVARTERGTTSLVKRTNPAIATQYFPTKIPPFQHGRPPYHRPHFQSKMKRKIDAEVGKAHYMRVAYRRQYVVGAIPGRQYYASPLSFPLTHPQPCLAWSMIITWQQVQIMRGESPKSYVRVVRGLTDLSQSTRRRTSSGRRPPRDDWRESLCKCICVCVCMWL